MTIFVYFIAGMIIGGVIVWFWVKSTAVCKEAIATKQTKEKNDGKTKILGLFENKSKITNNDVKLLLGVSDATATRYLDELEKEGKVHQVGITGQGVYYELISR